MSGGILLIALFFCLHAGCNRPARDLIRPRPPLTAEVFEIPQGAYIQLPFGDRAGIEKVSFTYAKNHFYCIFQRSIPGEERTALFISRSGNLSDWETPRLVAKVAGEAAVTAVDFDWKNKEQPFRITVAGGRLSTPEIFAGDYGKSWRNVPAARSQKAVAETGGSARRLAFARPRASHYEVEADSLRRLFVVDWLNNRRYFTGLPSLSAEQFLLVDAKANLYLAYDNRRSLALPYFEKGPGLVRLNLQKLTADSDGDGLRDILEISWGLDPRRPDSDRDGLPDGRDPDPLARNDSAFSLEDSLRQAALKFVLPEAILQDSAAVISVVTGDGREQSFFNHRCTILCNVSLPADNLHLGVPEVFGKDSAAIEVSYRGPLTAANGFTLLLKKTSSRRWRVVGLERRWSQ